MKIKVITLALAVGAVAWGGAGSVITSFQLPGQPAYGVRGLAYDWSDGNIWAAGPNANNDCIFAKFNPTNGSLVSSWTPLSGAVWAFDIGYGYLHGGARHLVVVDKTSPRVKLFSTAGSWVATLSDPFMGGFDEGLDCDWNGTFVWATNTSFNAVRRWSGAAWAAWTSLPALPPYGVAAGWGRVFVVTDSPDYTIYEYDAPSGLLNRSLSLKDWTRHMVGMSIGRVNAAGNDESLFIACYQPETVVVEVSVGNVTDAAVVPSSLGSVKALFR